MVGAALLLVSGCAAHVKLMLSPAELRDELSRRLPDRGREIEVAHEIPPALAEEARRVAEGHHGNRAKLRAIVSTLFTVRHDYDLTGGAERILLEGRGDCVSATSLLIGLTRAAGIDTYFAEAVTVDDSTSEGDLEIYYRHMVAAYGPWADATILDFGRPRRSYIGFRPMSDLEAVAQYHNAQGVQALKRGDPSEARRRFEIAVALVPEAAWPKSNLGVALRRQGLLNRAESVLREALKADPEHAPAHANLAAVLEMTGQPDQAGEHRTLARELRAGRSLR